MPVRSCSSLPERSTRRRTSAATTGRNSPRMSSKKGSRSSCRSSKRPVRWPWNLLSPVTKLSKIATTSSLVTHLDIESAEETDETMTIQPKIRNYSKGAHNERTRGWIAASLSEGELDVGSGSRVQSRDDDRGTRRFKIKN